MNRIAIAFGAALAVLATAGAAEPEFKSATYKITKVHRYEAQVVRIAGQGLTLDIEGFGRRRYQVPHDFTFEIEDQQVPLRQLVPGQRLRIYITQVESGELLLMQDEVAADGIAGEDVGSEDGGSEDTEGNP